MKKGQPMTTLPQAGHNIIHQNMGKINILKIQMKIFKNSSINTLERKRKKEKSKTERGKN